MEKSAFRYRTGDSARSLAEKSTETFDPSNRLAALTVGDLLQAIRGISVTLIWERAKPISVLHGILSIYH